MKRHAFSFDHPEQRVELASSRGRFRIQNQGLSVSGLTPESAARWTLERQSPQVKQVQGDGK
jgi:hypothetical protein